MAERNFARQISRLFGLFEILAEQGIKPFSTGSVGFIEKVRRPDWSKLPEELHYLVEHAEYYGRMSDEDEVVDFVSSAEEDDLATVARLAEQIRAGGHMKQINAFLKKYPGAKHEESALLFTLTLLLDHAVGLP